MYIYCCERQYLVWDDKVNGDAKENKYLLLESFRMNCCTAENSTLHNPV